MSKWCHNCGYDLSGLDGQHCPECGLDLEQADVVSISHRIAQFVAIACTVFPGLAAIVLVAIPVPVFEEISQPIIETIESVGYQLVLVLVLAHGCVVFAVPRLISRRSSTVYFFKFMLTAVILDFFILFSL